MRTIWFYARLITKPDYCKWHYSTSTKNESKTFFCNFFIAQYIVSNVAERAKPLNFTTIVIRSKVWPAGHIVASLDKTFLTLCFFLSGFEQAAN